MKTFFQIFLLMCGVFGVDADEVKSVSVMEGDSVTLNPDLTEIQKIIQMQWRFGDPVIAKIDGNKILYPNYTDIFRGRLQLTQTGSLTIKNMRTKHTGIYKLSIDLSTGRLQKTFSVTVYETPSVIDAGEAEVKIMSMEEGKSVILQTDVTELSGDELIVWRFGDEGKLIAKADIEIKNSTLYGTTDERFKDRLQLNHQTGSLTITNTRTTDSGLYKLQISSSSSKQTLYKKFTLIVTVRVFTEPGLSSGAKAGIVFAVLLVAAAATAAVVAMIYYCRKIAEMQKLSKQLAELSKQLKKLLEFFKDLPKTSKQFKNLLESIEQLLAEHKELSEERKKELSVECDRLKKLLNSCETLKKTLEDFEKELSEISEKLKELFENNISKQIQKICRKLQRKVKNMPVNEGGKVTLNPEVEIQENDHIEWLFGDEKNSHS
ncbi:uncharacterized protein LOC127154102 isoform X2 [Labeo rohita]|uniref:uncharacterized protein LOC127154102 isoform X2 n=1 Tax=Labeo rohita TaxID=84645 RepID=UPI0021E20430|nr:uncharacterized protein LOC127154102 isoform X2 [Labeo rohita]